MTNWVLGIASSHDGGVCLLKDGKIHTAIREERLTGVKRQRIFAGRESLALRYCLDAASIEASDLSAVVAGTQRSGTELENDITLNPDLRHAPNLKRNLASHHLAHAAGALGQSGFESCAILVCDGLGSPLADVKCSADTRVFGPKDGSEHLTLYRANGTKIEPLEIHVCRDWVEKTRTGLWHFGSLGGMYGAVSHLIFGNADEAGKVMGLAPYGRARFRLDEFLSIHDGQIRFTDAIHTRLQQIEDCETGQEARDSLLCDLAASVQAALETALIHFVRHLREITGETRLCLAGGVALNCTANQRIIEEGGFDDHFIMPASDDAGTAIGAAYLGHWQTTAKGTTTTHRLSRIRHDAHGRPPTRPEIEAAIAGFSDLSVERPDDLAGAVVDRLVRGEIGGYMSGRAEFGPRALGQRSIIAAPTEADMKDRINAGVKFREAFRPFAPVVPEAQAADWFEFGESSPLSPFMLRAVPFNQARSTKIPAVVHTDGTGRLQTLNEVENPGLFSLAMRYFDKTGVPILLNTSMNLGDEPIVETPYDALWTLMGTSMSFCVIGDHLVTKPEGARSVLDLVPRVAAKGWSLALPVQNGVLSRQTDREDSFRAEVETPWGVTLVTVPPRLTPLLSKIDGTGDGHAMLVQQVADVGSGRDEGTTKDAAQRLIQDLLLLRRMHVITLEQPAP